VVNLAVVYKHVADVCKWLFCQPKLPIGSEIVMNIKFVRPNLIKTKIEQDIQVKIFVIGPV
jgi:hypothetical protein